MDEIRRMKIKVALDGVIHPLSPKIEYWTRVTASPPRAGPSSLLPRALRETAAVWYPGTESVSCSCS